MRTLAALVLMSGTLALSACAEHHATTADIVSDAVPLYLRNGSVRLQVRAGAGGGNPNRVDMAGTMSIYVRGTSPTPLPMTLPVDMSEEATAFVRGGLIPAGYVFRIERVVFAGACPGDTNGPGRLIVMVPGHEIMKVENRGEMIADTWTGSVDVAPGDEHSVYIEVANSSVLEARFEGRLIKRPAPVAGR